MVPCDDSPEETPRPSLATKIYCIAMTWLWVYGISVFTWLLPSAWYLFVLVVLSAVVAVTGAWVWRARGEWAWMVLSSICPLALMVYLIGLAVVRLIGAAIRAWRTEK